VRNLPLLLLTRSRTGPGYNLIFDPTYKHLYGTTAAGGYGEVYEITPRALFFQTQVLRLIALSH
jgi:hypothetical protein